MSLIGENLGDNATRDAALDSTDEAIAEKGVAKQHPGTSDQIRKRTAQQSPSFVSTKLLSVGFVFALVLATELRPFLGQNDASGHESQPEEVQARS
jgi:hypothetical protein